MTTRSYPARTLSEVGSRRKASRKVARARSGSPRWSWSKPSWLRPRMLSGCMRRTVAVSRFGLALPAEHAQDHRVDFARRDDVRIDLERPDDRSSARRYSDFGSSARSPPNGRRRRFRRRAGRPRRKKPQRLRHSAAARGARCPNATYACARSGSRTIARSCGGLGFREPAFAVVGEREDDVCARVVRILRDRIEGGRRSRDRTGARRRARSRPLPGGRETAEPGSRRRGRGISRRRRRRRLDWRRARNFSPSRTTHAWSA